MNRLTTSHGTDTYALERKKGFGWGWLLVIGAALVVLGLLAFLNLPSAGTVSVHAVGIVMVIGAFAQLGTALLVPGWRAIGLVVLSAIFYGAAGIFAIANPTLAATPLTLLLAIALIFSGMTRFRLPSIMPSLPGWGWVAASAFVSVVSGLIFIHFLLLRPAWHLGVVLAVDLTFQGAMAIASGLALKGAPRSDFFVDDGTM